jgi:hypothetical protein
MAPHPTASDGGAGIGAPDREPRVIHRRVDWLTVAFRCDREQVVAWYERIVRLLQREAERWLATGTTPPQHVAVAIELRGIPFQAKLTRARDVHLANGMFAAVVRPATAEVSLDFKGVYWLQGHRPAEAMDHAEVVAEALGWRPEVPELPAHLRRLDLAVDVEHGELSRADLDAFVMQRRAKARIYNLAGDAINDGDDDAPAATNHFERSGAVNAIYVCSRGSPIMARLYDKSLELSEHSPDKRDAEHECWRRGVTGRDGTSTTWRGGRVWRYEFQLRSEALREMRLHGDGRSLREHPRLALDHLDAIWRKLVGHRNEHGYERGWLRLVELDTATERRRCRVDARWAALRDVVWSADQPPVERRRVTRGPDVLQVQGTVLAGLAKCGALPPVPEVYDEHGEVLSEESINKLSGAESERWLREHARVLGDGVAALLGPELVAYFDRGDGRERATRRALGYARNRWWCAEARSAVIAPLGAQEKLAA